MHSTFMTKVMLTLLNPCDTHEVRIPRQSRTLKNAGYDLSIISFRSDESYKQNEIINGVQLTRIDLFGKKSLPFVKYFEYYKAAWKMIERERPDIMYCWDLNTLYLGVKAKKLLGTKLIYYSGEYFPGLVRDDIRYGFGHLFYKIYEHFEKKWFPLCDAVMTVNDNIRQIFMEKYGRDAVLIMNTPERSFFKDYKIHDKKVVGYSGYINWVRGVDKLVLAAKEIVDHDNEFKFLIAGFGNYEGEIRKLIKENSLESHFTITGKIPNSKMPLYYAQMSVGTITFQPTTNNMLGSPSKLFDYMGAGKALLVSDFPVMGGIVKTENCGEVVDPTNPIDIAEKILSMFEKKKVIRYGKNARKAFETKYNWEIMEKRLLKVFEEVAG